MISWFVIFIVGIVLISVLVWGVFLIDEVNYRMGGVASPQPIYNSVESLNSHSWLWSPGVNYRIYYFEKIEGWVGGVAPIWNKCERVKPLYWRIIQKESGAETSFVSGKIDFAYGATDKNAYFIYFRPQGSNEKLVLLWVYDDDADFLSNKITLSDICNK